MSKPRPEISRCADFYVEETHQKHPGNHCLFFSEIFFYRLPECLSAGVVLDCSWKDAVGVFDKN
jgi:hypothetical protein